MNSIASSQKQWIDPPNDSNLQTICNKNHYEHFAHSDITARTNTPYRVSQSIAEKRFGIAFVDPGKSSHFSAAPELSQSVDILKIAFEDDNDPSASFISAVKTQEALKATVLREWRVSRMSFLPTQESPTDRTLTIALLFEEKGSDRNLVAQVSDNSDRLIVQQRVRYSAHITEKNMPLVHRIAALIHSKPLLFYTDSETAITFEYPQPVYQNFLLPERRIFSLVADEDRVVTGRIMQTSADDSLTTSVFEEGIPPENIKVHANEEEWAVHCYLGNQHRFPVFQEPDAAWRVSLDDKGHPHLTRFLVTEEQSTRTLLKTGITQYRIVQDQERTQRYLVLENEITQTQQFFEDLEELKTNKPLVPHSADITRSLGSYPIERMELRALSSLLDDSKKITEEQWAATWVMWEDPSLLKNQQGNLHTGLLLEIFCCRRSGFLVLEMNKDATQSPSFSYGVKERDCF